MLSLLRRHPAAIIFTVALFLRLAWIATLQDELAWIDEQEFATVAQHIAHGDGYVSTSFRANPILPYYLGAVFRLFGEHYAVARIGQAILGAVTCVIIYRLGLLMFSPAVGILGGLLLAVYPPHIYLTGVFYVDCWLTFFCALAVYLAALTLEARGALWLALLCGVSLGLTTLTRAAFLTCLPCVALAWIYGGRWGWKRDALACATMVLGCALVILPWTVRNYRVYGRPMLVSSGFYTMLWRGNNVLADGGADDRHLMWYNDLWQARLDRLPPEQRQAIKAEYDRVDRRVHERYAEVGDMYLTTDEVLKPIAIDSLLSNPSHGSAHVAQGAHPVQRIQHDRDQLARGAPQRHRRRGVVLPDSRLQPRRGVARAAATARVGTALPDDRRNLGVLCAALRLHALPCPDRSISAPLCVVRTGVSMLP
jgi:hypothetical protein